MKTSVNEVRDVLSVLSVDAVKERIGQVPGVKSVAVNCAAGTAIVRYDETRFNIAYITSVVRLTGYTLSGESLPKHLAETKPAHKDAGAPSPQGGPAFFAVLVFAGMLRSFGVRSDTMPVWRIPLFTNIKLVIVVAVSFGLQVWSQHNAMPGSFLKTSSMPLDDCFLLLAMGAIPLLVLELVKVVRNSRRQKTNES